MKVLLSLILFFTSSMALADALTGNVERQPVNIQAIVMFLLFVGFTLYITYWASKELALALITIPLAEKLQVSKMEWRLRVTLCPQPHSWGSPHWFILQDTMGLSTPSVF